MRVRDWLVAARARGVDRLDAQVLLAHCLGRPRAWLLGHDDEAIAAAAEAAATAALERRLAGEPLAYIVGRKEFYGLDLQVNAAVLVPRPETELLVEWALESLPPDAAGTVVDLGTGSGAIAIAVACARPRARVVATDCSAAALAVASRNADTHRAGVEFLAGSWWQPLGPRRVDVALANPPYVAAGDPHLQALRHEPAAALVAGPSGLEALQEIVAAAPHHLNRDAALLLEHGCDQGSAVRTLLENAGFVDIATRRDLAGNDRCTGGRLRR